MVKKYAENSPNYKVKPTKETIQFLIDFSKSLKILKSETNKLIEINLN